MRPTRPCDQYLGGSSLAVQWDVANTQRAPVPCAKVTTTQARVKVKCHGNVFFDISDADFIIR